MAGGRVGVPLGGKGPHLKARPSPPRAEDSHLGIVVESLNVMNSPAYGPTSLKGGVARCILLAHTGARTERSLLPVSLAGLTEPRKGVEAGCFFCVFLDEIIPRTQRL